MGSYFYSSADFSSVVATAETRKVFIDQAIIFLREYGFDGLSVDWFYPTVGHSLEIDLASVGLPEDKDRFTTFLEVTIESTSLVSISLFE